MLKNKNCSFSSNNLQKRYYEIIKTLKNPAPPPKVHFAVIGNLKISK